MNLTSLLSTLSYKRHFSDQNEELCYRAAASFICCLSILTHVLLRIVVRCGKGAWILAASQRPLSNVAVESATYINAQFFFQWPSHFCVIVWASQWKEKLSETSNSILYQRVSCTRQYTNLFRNIWVCFVIYGFCFVIYICCNIWVCYFLIYGCVYVWVL